MLASSKIDNIKINSQIKTNLKPKVFIVINKNTGKVVSKTINQTIARHTAKLLTKQQQQQFIIRTES